MRSSQVIAIVVVVAAVIGTSIALLAAPRIEEPTPAAAPVRRVEPPSAGAPFDPSLPLSTSPGATCDERQAPSMLKRARAKGDRPRDHLTIVPRAMLDRGLTGMVFQPAFDQGAPAGVQLAAVTPDSVAAELGFRQLDVVGQASGQPVAGVADLPGAFERFRESGVSCVRVWRHGTWHVRWFVLAQEP